MEQLQSKLHSYSLFGLPKVPQQLSFHKDSWGEGEGGEERESEEEEEETNLAMEDSWQMLLDHPQVHTEREGRSECVFVGWEAFSTQEPSSDESTNTDSPGARRLRLLLV